MNFIYSLMLGLVLGGAANTLVGVGGFIDLLGTGLVDDILIFIAKRFVPGMSELSLVESFAVSLFTAELEKIEHQEQADEEDERRAVDERSLFARVAPFEVPRIYGQFDISDLGLLWWSTNTVIASDIPAELLGVAGEAAVVL
ncbi:MAG: hypothetical protein ACRD4Q_00085 [Candidatus Acidiferrales bacterium]